MGKRKIGEIYNKPIIESGIRPVNTTPFNMDRFKDLIEKLKVKQNE